MLLYDREKHKAVTETGKEILHKLISDNPDLNVFDNEICILFKDFNTKETE